MMSKSSSILLIDVAQDKHASFVTRTHPDGALILRSKIHI